MASTSTMSGTRVALTGEVHVSLPAGRAELAMLPGAQARTTLAYLVLHRQDPTSAERLAQVLWPLEQPATWRPALRGVVTRVRSFLTEVDASALLTSGTGGYRLQLPEPVTVDIETARRNLARAEIALDRSQHATAISAAAATQAVASRRFVPGTTGPWVTSVETELQALHLRALQVMGRVHLEREEPDRAARVAREAIAVAPLHEPSHRLLMRALAADGQTTEATLAFDRCRAALADAHGVGPSAETVALVGELLRESS